MKQPLLSSKLYATRHQGGFTLIELLTVIAIVGVLAAILIPALGKVRERSMMTKKTSNYRQYFIANTLYANDNKGYTCPAKDARNGGELWQILLSPYLVGAEKNQVRTDLEIFRDPFFEEYNSEQSWLGGVGMNVKIRLPESTAENVYWNEAAIEDGRGEDFKLGMIKEPATRIFMGDSTNWFVNTKKVATNRHEDNTKGMFVRFDGSVELLDADQATLALEDPAALRSQ
ncbi:MULTISPECIES: type II secretion system protein [unclassified Lentimonas]|uniref:type II secretion system protein n=1 Tax=unclassified Lentimonas TaxID=2630993 RepID=UPI00138A35C9|nr:MULTISPECIES: prepilin-type N-terminal cleavage/methylation domain-containing protein [unclassified Lentimonas]